MKLKYYLRGAGVGVLVTTIIFSIAFAFYEPQLSKEEIIQRASALGMVMPEEEKDGSGTASDWKNLQEDDTTSDGDEDSGNDPSQENAQSIEQVEFTVAAGDTSAVVAQRLQEMGLVDDGASFDHYLADQDMDNALLPGTYTIPKGSSYLEIAQVLTTKQTAPTEQ